LQNYVPIYQSVAIFQIEDLAVQPVEVSPTYLRFGKRTLSARPSATLAVSFRRQCSGYSSPLQQPIPIQGQQRLQRLSVMEELDLDLCPLSELLRDSSQLPQEEVTIQCQISVYRRRIIVIDLQPCWKRSLALCSAVGVISEYAPSRTRLQLIRDNSRASVKYSFTDRPNHWSQRMIEIHVTLSLMTQR
jgi:hypothetical protein